MEAKVSDWQGLGTLEDVARQLCGMPDDEVAELLFHTLQRLVALEHQLRTLQASHAQYIHQAHLERDGPAPWHEPHA